MKESALQELEKITFRASRASIQSTDFYGMAEDLLTKLERDKSKIQENFKTSTYKIQKTFVQEGGIKKKPEESFFLSDIPVEQKQSLKLKIR